MNNTAIAINEEHALIEKMKCRFMYMEKEEMAEFLAVLSAKLIKNRVEFGCSLEQETIEGIIGRNDENIIRDTFYIDFSKYDRQNSERHYFKGR